MKTDVFLLFDDMIESIKDLKKMVVHIHRKEKNVEKWR